jgi:hypothetical protein
VNLCTYDAEGVVSDVGSAFQPALRPGVSRHDASMALYGLVVPNRVRWTLS